VRYCPRGICRRARRCLPPPADAVTYRCPVMPHDMWVRHRQRILDMVWRAYFGPDAAKKISGR
jgi:hypothetical protein